jgi:hypothetical protein
MASNLAAAVWAASTTAVRQGLPGDEGDPCRLPVVHLHPHRHLLRLAIDHQ